MGHILNGQVLEINQEASELHGRGINLAKTAITAWQFENALDTFYKAEGVLEDDPLTFDKEVQGTRIRRDRHFTMVRAGIRLAGPELAQLGEQALEDLAQVTESLVTNPLIDSLHLINPKTQPGKAELEARSEHGMTISLHAAATMIRHLLMDVDLRDNAEVASKIENRFSEADDFLSVGTNSFYYANNTMRTAQFHVLSGQPWRVLELLPAAGRSFERSLVYDRRNFIMTPGTLLRRFIDLRSYEAAQASVLTHP